MPSHAQSSLLGWRGRIAIAARERIKTGTKVDRGVLPAIHRPAITRVQPGVNHCPGYTHVGNTGELANQSRRTWENLDAIADN